MGPTPNKELGAPVRPFGVLAMRVQPKGQERRPAWRAAAGSCAYPMKREYPMTIAKSTAQLDAADVLRMGAVHGSRSFPRPPA